MSDPFAPSYSQLEDRVQELEAEVERLTAEKQRDLDYLTEVRVEKNAEIERLTLVVQNYRLGGRWKGSEIDDLIAENERLQAENERLTAEVSRYERALEFISIKFEEIADEMDILDSKPSIKFDGDHVFDKNDTPEHVTSPDCWCGPVKDTECESLWIHNHSSHVNRVSGNQESGQFTGLKQDPPQKIDHRLDCAYYVGHPCDSGCKSDLVEELEMWAKHNPTDTSIPFGKLFTRAATELKRLEADLVDRIKGERSAWRQVLELRGAADSRLSPSERDWEDALRDKIADLTAENERLTATQKYLCNCLEEVGVDSSAALAAAEGITLPEECPFSGEACDCTDDRGIRAKRCPRTITKHPYGYCPVCLRPGVNRERRPNGNDRCSIGHEYPSAQALYEDKT